MRRRVQRRSEEEWEHHSGAGASEEEKGVPTIQIISQQYISNIHLKQPVLFTFFCDELWDMGEDVLAFILPSSASVRVPAITPVPRRPSPRPHPHPRLFLTLSLPDDPPGSRRRLP